MKDRNVLILLLIIMLVWFPVALFAADSTGTSEPSSTESGDSAFDPADEEPADPGLVGDEEPTYTNAAQAMHAANLAMQAALEPNPETEQVAEDLDAAREAYQDAKEALAEAPDDPLLQEEFEKAQETLNNARQDYADTIGELAGVMGEEVQQMRQSGMGWGQIAHELGVHPGSLGLGHSKKKGGLDPVEGFDDLAYGPDADIDPQQEILEATKRDKQSGWSKAHGLSTSDSKSSGKGLGLSKTSAADGVSTSPGKSAQSQGAAGSKSANASSNSRGSGGEPSSSSNSSNGKGKDKDKSNKSNNGKGKGKGK